ncbi:hypothetical protein PGIGA_G00239340 [Pangasianodon gigas]|uniref:Uncharacterized protein n=1 Tax=Pangasianodon gigas TaxID=30993 RepID=A0ACC5WMN8_PANGG|nr:hypothetical protein [Pangasianodon gigas]
MESSSLIQHSTPLSWISSSYSGSSLCEIRRSARMRNLTALLFLLSLCSLHLVSSGTTDAKIPKWNIKNYWWTGSSCTIKAIVFETKLNKRICVDPTAVWVSGHMKTSPLDNVPVRLDYPR